MDIAQLRKLLSQEESAKLEFKIQPYKLNEPKPDDPKERQKWKDDREQAWAELTKDILSLANGNIRTEKETGYLVIGVGNKLDKEGKRALHDVGDKIPSRKEILDKVNSYCQPQIPDVICEYLELEGKRLFIISIPPVPYLYRFSKQLKTPKKEFSPHTVLIRRGDGEQIYEASKEEQEAILNEKRFALSTDDPTDGEPQEARQVLHLENYEVKMQIYRSTQKLLVSILREGTTTLAQLFEFSRDTDEAIFLFDKRVANYLQTLYKRGVKLCFYRDRLSHLSIGPERTKLVEEESELLTWFIEQIEVSRNLFYNYISL